MDFDPESVRAFERAGWERAAGTYEAAFATATRPYIDPLLDAVGPAASLLDLCCGPGFVAAGARGIVSAGFAPGFSTPGEAAALKEAIAKGVVAVQSTRAGSGRTFQNTRLAEAGILIADNLNPQKARILLSLALTVTQSPEDIMRIFRTY